MLGALGSDGSDLATSITSTTTSFIQILGRGVPVTKALFLSRAGRLLPESPAFLTNDGYTGVKFSAYHPERGVTGSKIMTVNIAGLTLKVLQTAFHIVNTIVLTYSKSEYQENDSIRFI